MLLMTLSRRSLLSASAALVGSTTLPARLWAQTPKEDG